MYTKNSRPDLPKDFKSAFQLADIRGIYPTQINEEVAFRVGFAFVLELKAKAVIVGQDMRLSSAQIASAFIDGARSAGANIIDIGLVTTPMLYFASGTDKLPGVMITASHSPKDYNGLKLVMSDAVPLTNKTGLSAIKKYLTQGSFAPAIKRGTYKKKNIHKAYEKSIAAKTNYKLDVEMNVVADAGNGMGTLLHPILKSYRKLHVKELYFSLDGTFPNHASNPTVAKNQKAIVSELRKGGYDFGFAFDGDADRVAFFDEKGSYVNAAHIGALIAADILSKNPKQKFIHTVLTSQSYTEAITENGGKLVAAKVGHSFIKEKMRKHKAVFACEHSAHFFYQEYFYADSVMITVIKVIQIFAAAKKKGCTFSQMLKPYSKYYQTEDYLIDVDDKKSVMERVVAWAVSDNNFDIHEFDGIEYTNNNCRVVIKPSVTESAINIICESTNKKVALAERNKVSNFIKSIL